MNTAQVNILTLERKQQRKKQFARTRAISCIIKIFSFVSFQFSVFKRWSAGNHGKRSFIQRPNGEVLAIATQKTPNKSNGERRRFIQCCGIFGVLESRLY